MKPFTALESYFEQFTGDIVPTGYLVTQGDAIDIYPPCPHCGERKARRASYVPFNGTMVNVWFCINCKQVF